MSPVERSSGHAVTALLVAGLGVAIAMGAAFGLAVLGNRGDVDLRLGDDEARVGDAEERLVGIQEEGPFYLQDPAGGERDVIVQNLGDDPEEGWLAFAARPPEAPRHCMIMWQPDEQLFVLLEPTGPNEGDVTDDCDGREYPADGGDLPRYEVTLRDGTLYLDPRSDER